MKILAALDLGFTTPAVLREVRAWASRLQAQVWLIHAAEPEPDFIGYEPGPPTVRAAVARQFHREHQQLEAAAGELRAAGLDVTALLIRGPTAEVILKEADRLGVDLILMGTHARGVWQEFWLGSTSKEVLHRSTRPLLIIPPRLTTG